MAANSLVLIEANGSTFSLDEYTTVEEAVLKFCEALTAAGYEEANLDPYVRLARNIGSYAGN